MWQVTSAFLETVLRNPDWLSERGARPNLSTTLCNKVDKALSLVSRSSDSTTRFYKDHFSCFVKFQDILLAIAPDYQLTLENKLAAKTKVFSKNLVKIAVI